MKRILLATLFACFIFGPAQLGASAQGSVEVVRSAINRGNALMRAHRFTEAISAYQDALKVDPGNLIAKGNIAEVYNNWGISCFSQHKYNEAAAQWQKCLELAPGHVNARRNMALMMHNLAQQGISLSDPTAAPAADNETNKANSSKSAVKASQSSQSPASTSAKLAPVEEESSGAVLILTPGLRQPGSSSAQAVRTLSNDPEGFSGGGSGPVGNSEPLPHADKASPLFPVTPQQFVDQSAPPLQRPVSQPAVQSFSLSGSVSESEPDNGAPVTPNTVVPNTVAPSAVVAGPAVNPVILNQSNAAPAVLIQGSATGGAASLEEQLSAVELKVYGQKYPDLTVLQRLEKIERDTSGKSQSGTIIERIDALKSNFGVQ